MRDAHGCWIQEKGVGGGEAVEVRGRGRRKRRKCYLHMPVLKTQF